jgi:hypothetical protein
MSYGTDLSSLAGMAQQLSQLQRRSTIPAHLELQGTQLTLTSGVTTTISWGQSIRNVGNAIVWPYLDDPANPYDPTTISVVAAGLYLLTLKFVSQTAVAYTVTVDVKYIYTKQTFTFSAGALINNYFTTTLYLYETSNISVSITPSANMTINATALSESPYLTLVCLSQVWDTQVGDGTHIIRTAAASIPTSTFTTIQWQSIPPAYNDYLVRQYFGFNTLRAFNTAASTGTTMRAPVSGTYLIQTNITWDTPSPAIAGSRYVYLTRISSGVTTVIAGYNGDALATGTERPVTVSIIEDLLAGDTVDVRVWQATGVNLNLIVSGTYVVNSFDMVLLSLT